jgi:hypothetical protein
MMEDGRHEGGSRCPHGKREKACEAPAIDRAELPLSSEGYDDAREASEADRKLS